MIPPPTTADFAGSLSATGLARALEKPTTDPKQAEDAAKDFESVLLHKLLEGMDRTVPKGSMLDSGATRQVRGMFWYYLAQDVARQGGLGLWKSIHEDMQRKMGSSAPQGAAQTPTVESSA